MAAPVPADCGRDAGMILPFRAGDVNHAAALSSAFRDIHVLYSFIMFLTSCRGESTFHRYVFEEILKLVPVFSGDRLRRFILFIL